VEEGGKVLALCDEIVNVKKKPLEWNYNFDNNKKYNI